MKRRNTVRTAFTAVATAMGVAFSAGANGIRWEQAKDITGDADVRTDGVLRYAYAPASAVVNGVQFQNGLCNSDGTYPSNGAQWNYIPNNLALMADVTLNSRAGAQATYTHPSGVSVDYARILDGIWYLSSTMQITLKNLTPGHAYIVQFWACDTSNNSRYLTVDGADSSAKVNCYYPGQHITGSFTAVAETQTFSLTPHKDVFSLFNAIQLRDVTPGCVEWEAARDITDDADVRTEGEPVFAIGWAPVTSVVNGVTFVPQSSIGELIGAGVSFYGGMAGYVPQALNTEIVQSLSDDYHRLMGGGVWKGSLSLVWLNLKGLVPGGRYLVQLWVNESRNALGPYRLMSVDGGVRLAFRKESYGQHVTGTFTAVSDVQSILLRPFWSGTGANAVTQVNALQLRRLDSGAATHWRVNHITQSDHDVRLDGNLLYAYNFSDAATDATVNGVTFRGYVRGGNRTSSTDDIAFALASNGGDADVGFTDATMSADYLLMLKTATWATGNATSSLTLKRLVPGHRYLVQLWVSEGRTDKVLTGRYMIVDNVATVNFHNAGVFTPPRGDVATGLFTATTSMQTITLLPRHYTSSPNVCVQLNGLQVRDLGAADSAVNVWAGGASGAWGEDATNWNDPAGSPREGTPWNAANGGTNTAVFAAATSAALPSADIAANGVVSSGALTIGEANDGRSIDVGFVEARSCTFKSGWAARTLAKYDLGSFTLEGASPNLAQVVAGGGSLAFSRADALKAGADVTVAKGATLTLADGATPFLSRLAGEGTFAIDGAGVVTITNESVQAFSGTLAGDMTMRKAGRGDWTLGGTHTGTLALDALEGTTILTTDGAAVAVAEGATVSLGGTTRSLGTVSGQGTIMNGTLSAALVVAGGSDITLGSVTLSAGVTLNGASSVTFAGDRQLSGLSVHIADPAAATASRKVVVAVEGEMTGLPAFTFGAGGYRAKLSDDGKGYVVTRPGFMLTIR